MGTTEFEKCRESSGCKMETSKYSEHGKIKAQKSA
jgi:hypothetical protein